MQLWIFPKTEHILLAPLNHRLLSVDQCSDGSYSYCFPNQSSMKCFTAFVRSLVLSVLFKDASNHLEPVTRGTQTQKREKQYETIQNRFLDIYITYRFCRGFLSFLGPKCPEISQAPLGAVKLVEGEGRSLFAEAAQVTRNVEWYSPLVHHSHPNYLDISWLWNNYNHWRSSLWWSLLLPSLLRPV